jgi:AcrR family transcriptional regulator
MTARTKTPPSPTPRKRLSSEQRREVLLAAAAQVFALHGYHGASIEEIAQRAEITKPVIYHHFASKQELHAAVFEHYARQLLDAAGSYGQSGSLRERFHDLVRGMFSFAHENPHVWQLLLGDSHDPETAPLQQRLRATGTRHVAERLLAEPTFQPETPLSRRKAAEVVAQLTRSAVDGLVSWSLEHPKTPRAALTETAAELLWTGLARTTTLVDVWPGEDKGSSG